MNDSRIMIAVSTVDDGTMKGAADELTIRDNRRNFLERQHLAPEHACIVRLEYAGDDYCRYHTVGTAHAGEGVTKESTVVADALLTREKGITLFLPLADCVGAVIWDKDCTALVVSHLGRHNLEQDGGARSVEYFASQTGVSLKDIKVYLSPAAGKDSYPIHSLNGKGLQEAAIEQLMSAGIDRANIEVDERDTAKDEQLFSHSEFLKGNRSDDGRFAVFAMLKK